MSWFGQAREEARAALDSMDGFAALNRKLIGELRYTSPPQIRGAMFSEVDYVGLSESG